MATELTPLAACAARAIARDARRRIPFETVRDALLDADLSLVGSPDARARMAIVVSELAELGLVTLPKTPSGWDRAILPPLPRWVLQPSLPRAPRPPTNVSVTWHATLGWAAASRWTPDQELLLHAVNRWLIKGGAKRPVPLQERSLELLGDEKALARFLRGPLFTVPGRLTLERLGAVRTSPPFVFTKTGHGPFALVIENSATYRSIVTALPPNSPVGVVAFGFGNGFVGSVEFFVELAESGQLDAPIHEIRYFGDLDEDGLRIPRSANVVASGLMLPPILPAMGLYQRLLDHGLPQARLPVDPLTATELTSWLPDELASRSAAHLVAGRRLAQEAVGLDLLLENRSWANLDELGVPPSSRPLSPQLKNPPTVDGAALLEGADAVRSPATEHY